MAFFPLYSDNYLMPVISLSSGGSFIFLCAVTPLMLTIYNDLNFSVYLTLVFMLSSINDLFHQVATFLALPSFSAFLLFFPLPEIFSSLDTTKQAVLVTAQGSQPPLLLMSLQHSVPFSLSLNLARTCTVFHALST